VAGSQGIEMNIQTGIGVSLEGKKSVDSGRTQGAAEQAKEVNVAQTTLKVVQDALLKAGPSSSVAPSAQLSVDPGTMSRLSGVDKAKDSEKLDTAKLDAIKAKLESGSFEFDYQAIAMSLVEQAVQRRGFGAR